MKKGRISFIGPDPMRVHDLEIEENSGLTPDQKATVRRVGETVREYLKTAKALAAGKYAGIKESIPDYLINPGNVLVACCPNGIVIRYEKESDSKDVITAWFPETIQDVAAQVSQYLIHCWQGSQEPSMDVDGIELKLTSIDKAKGVETVLYSMSIRFDLELKEPEVIDPPPNKPLCAASIRNEFEFGMQGEIVPVESGQSDSQQFLTRSKFRLPVGWECIEIYPSLDLSYWKPDYAPSWAEKDILAAVVTNQHRDAHFQSLDPNAAARKHHAAVLAEFRALLDSDPDREEYLQTFLRDYPFLLCPTFKNKWPKLPLGGNVTDFVFCDAAGSYLLVELEKSTPKLFRKNGHPTAKLNEAIGQITDWKRYLEDNLATVQRELGLSGISTNPMGLVVIGRSPLLSETNRRKLVAMMNSHPMLQIKTYDDVYDNAKAVIENLLGRIWEASGNTQIYYL